ncbi:hypothetical protein JCM8097_006940 [Rhodosporidiobolus ruineniae]
MSNTTLDDTSPLLSYTGPWTRFAGVTNNGWTNDSYTSCGGEGTGNGTACWLRVPFTGTYAALYGDANKDHGTFHCSLETSSSGSLQPEGEWAWYFGGAMSNGRPYQTNALLCAVQGIPEGEHTLVLGVEAQQVPRGIAVDYVNISTSVPAGTAYSWSSLFNSAVPPTDLRNTTATPTLPQITSSSVPSTGSMPSSGGGGSSSLAVGLGAGLGSAAALALVALAAWVFLRRRRRRRGEQYDPDEPIRGAGGSGPHERRESDGHSTYAGSDWYPGRSEVGVLSAAAAGAGAGGGGAAYGEKAGQHKYEPVGVGGGAAQGSPQRERGGWMGFEESPPPGSGFAAYGAGGTGYAAHPYGYSPSANSQQSFHPAGSSPTGGGAYPAYTAPAHPSPPSAAYAAQHHPHRGSLASQTSAPRDYSALIQDLPDDATLADPGEFAERR